MASLRIAIQRLPQWLPPNDVDEAAAWHAHASRRCPDFLRENNEALDAMGAGLRHEELELMRAIPLPPAWYADDYCPSVAPHYGVGARPPRFIADPLGETTTTQVSERGRTLLAHYKMKPPHWDSAGDMDAPPGWGWRVYDYSGLGREGVRVVFLTTAARYGAIPWEYDGFCYFEVLRGPEFGGVKLRWAERGSQIVVAQVPVSLPPVLPPGFDFDAREQRVARAAYPERRRARTSRKGQGRPRGE